VDYLPRRPKRGKSLSDKSNSTARILIVDDHPIVRQGYAQLIGNQPDLEVCGFAESEEEGVRQVKSLQPDLVVIDLALKDSHGIELIKQLAPRQPAVKMLVVSAHDENLFADRALDAGALGYINKQEATEQLIGGIRTVLAGDVYLSERMTKQLLKRRVAHASSESPDQSPIALLTDRELEVFQFIGEGLSSREIADKMFLSRKTIDRYRENIKSKLDLSHSAQLVQRATQWVLENH
jgi:DNA-binding NarL/FixJ family response regulator